MKNAATNSTLSGQIAKVTTLILILSFNFLFTIKAQPPCNGIPQAGNIIAFFQNPVCPGAPFTMLYNPVQSGITFQWQSSSNGINFFLIPNAFQQQLTTSVMQPTYFRVKVTCTQSGLFSVTNVLNTTLVQPVITYPAVSVQLNNGESTHPDNTGYVTFATPCCQGLVTYSDAVTSNCCQILILRTWTIIDCFGDGVQFTQTIIVLLDVSAPVITCTPFGPGACNTTPTPDPGSVTVTDECPGTLTVATSETAGPGCLVVTTFTWTATDQCGHSATCTQTYSRIMDAIPPVIVCPTPVVLPCNTTPTPSVGLISATDNCGTPEIGLLNSSSTSSGCLITSTFTWRATDACGNFADCNQVFTSIHDLVPPVIHCPAPDTLPCNTTPTPSPTLISATDNCGIPMISLQGTSSSILGCATTTIFTWRATDACGNFADCDQILVSIFDEFPPTIHCPNPVALPCNTTPIASPAGISAQDNCGIPTLLNIGVTVTTVGCLKTFVFTWKATDACGNFAVCDEIFTSIFDYIDPFIECPEPVFLPCNTTPVPDPSLISVADNCGTPSLTLIGTDISNINCLRIFEFTWRATDDCGNFSECTQVYFSDFDIIPPEIICPDPDTFCNVTPSPNISMISATDNCGIVDISLVGTSSTSNGCITNYYFTWKATDDCGNMSTCDQVIHVINDMIDPVINDCPNTQSVPNDEGLCGAFVSWTSPTATDNCGLRSFTSNYEPNSFFVVGITIVTYTAIDLCGNVTTCSFNILVEDLEPPWNMHCPGVIIKDNDLGLCGAKVTWTTTASDNCEVATIVSVPASGSEFPVGITPVVVTATDVHGNTWTCTFNVHINDKEKPVFENCPLSTTKFASNGFCIAFVDWPEIVVTDNCALQAVELVPNFLHIYPVGITQTVYTATDIYGNVETCSFNVEVIDTTRPVINNCPADIRVDNEPGFCKAKVTWVEPTATDECAVLSLTSNFNSGDDFPVGEYLVIYTATDINGNISTCTFTIDVDDVEKPFILSHDIVTCDTVVSYSFFMDDNCSIDRFSYIPPSGSVFHPGTTTQVYVEAWDSHNNREFKYFDVTVLLPPSVIDSLKASNNEICFGDSITLTAYFDTLGTGGVVKFYKDICNQVSVIDSAKEIDNSWSIKVKPSVKGVVTYYARIEGYCDTTDCFPITITVNLCPVILQTNIFLEGYYLGNGLMSNCLNITGFSVDPQDADSIFLSAMDANPPYPEVDRQPGILKTNGYVTVTFGTAVVTGNSYYLKINHRNSVETWSKVPVLLTTSTTYLFSSAATQAYGDNQITTFDNVGYAIFSGDINQDKAIDISDFLELDPHIQNGDGGYIVYDINGDGAVDISDFLLLDPNIQNGIGAAIP